MNVKPLISIAIPTYNRSSFLKNLLDHIVPEAKELGGMVQICISDNCSTDATQEIVAGFLQQYPDLIIYHKNQENLGVNINLIKVMEMAQGQFVWLLGDDDMITVGGIKKIIHFIETLCNEATGLITLGHKSYFVDSLTKEEVVFFDTVQEDMPQSYPLSREDVIGLSFPNSTFLSILLYKNTFLQKILIEERALWQEALKARDYVHTFLYQLMFLKYPQLQAMRYNQAIIEEELHYYKFYIEDKFKLHYVIKKRLDNLLLSSNYSGDYKKITTGWDARLLKGTIIEMIEMRCFNALNYESVSGCIGMFSREAEFKDALLLSISFMILLIAPPFLVKYTYKRFVMSRHKKNWQKVWLYITTTNSKMAQGTRRQLS